MTWSVYQHWDPLKVCVVGRSYPPEFYSWIQVPRVRNLFEKIAIETEEDFQAIIKTLEKFGVDIMRPEIKKIDTSMIGKFPCPPMTPRDTMIMIGQTFYRFEDYWHIFYNNIKDPSWSWFDSADDFLSEAQPWQIEEAKNIHKFNNFSLFFQHEYQHIFAQIKKQGNSILTNLEGTINGAMVSRIGRDLYFATDSYDQDQNLLLAKINQRFPQNRNHIVNTGGHGDGTYCPVCPGLIISLRDVPTYSKTFPDWEVVYLPGQSWSAVKPFLDLKKKNSGKWWIPGFEYDQSVIDVVESWLAHWTGYVEETVFDVNMLVIDPKNVMVFNYNKQVFDALDRYGITAHVVPFRHRYFWDGGIHCVTLDLHRDGMMQDYFPQRG
jgi:glycine amidinotransferase